MTNDLSKYSPLRLYAHAPHTDPQPRLWAGGLLVPGGAWGAQLHWLQRGLLLHDPLVSRGHCQLEKFCHVILELRQIVSICFWFLDWAQMQFLKESIDNISREASMLTTCLGPNDLLVLAIRRGHGEVEVPVIRDNTWCSVTTGTGPRGLTTTGPIQLLLLVHGAAGVNRELL